jgi:hypothetical protein
MSIGHFGNIALGQYRAEHPTIDRGIPATAPITHTPVVDTHVPTAAAPSPAPTPVVADGSTNASAKATLAATLEANGFPAALADTAWQMYLSGVPDAQIILNLRQTDVYKQYFPGLDKLRSEGLGVSENDYNNAIYAMEQTAHAYGISGYTRADYGKAFSGGVSPTEFSQRVQLANDAVNNLDPNQKAAVQRLTGLHDGDLTTYFLKGPDALPELQRKVDQAKILGVGADVGFGLTDAQAELLRSQGISDVQARAGLSNLAGEQDLLGAAVGTGEAQISADTALAAQFGGSAEAQRLLAQRQQQRLAAVRGGGQATIGQRGISGFAQQD